jgi:uncharacterized membrane protein YvbJ
MKKCPYCAEEVQDEAVICRYCNNELNNGKEFEITEIETKKIRKKRILFGCIFIPIFLVGLCYLSIFLFNSWDEIWDSPEKVETKNV